MAINIGVVDCTTNAKGTGVGACFVGMNDAQFFILVKKGWSIALATTFDESAVKELVQDGTFIVLPNHQSIEVESEDYVYETTDSGYKIPVRDGLVEFMAQYAKGLCLHKALRSISWGAYDLLIVDYDNNGNGRLWGVEDVTSFKGFDLNLINAETFTMTTGTERGKSPFRLQFSAKGTVEFNNKANFVRADSFDVASLNGVRDVNILPIDLTGGTLKVEVIDACDNSTKIAGLDDLTMWKLVDNTGAPVVASSISYANGVYTFAGMQAGEVIVSLYDTVLDTAVVNDGSLFYASDELSALLVP